jgi:hypothetical protein
MGVIRRLNRFGDTELQWTREYDQDARALFNAHLALGGLAFEIGDPREPAEVVRAFNPEAREIILAPRMKGG